MTSDPLRVLDAIPALIFHKDAGNRLVYGNHAALQACGAESAAALAGTTLRHWLGDAGGLLDAADLRVLRSGQPQLAALEQIQRLSACCRPTRWRMNIWR